MWLLVCKYSFALNAFSYFGSFALKTPKTHSPVYPEECFYVFKKNSGCIFPCFPPFSHFYIVLFSGFISKLLALTNVTDMKSAIKLLESENCPCFRWSWTWTVCTLEIISVHTCRTELSQGECGYLPSHPSVDRKLGLEHARSHPFRKQALCTISATDLGSEPDPSRH